MQPSASAPPPETTPRSLLEIGGVITLAGLAFGALVGIIAVVDADASAAGFGVGIGIAFLIFFSGATIATALACLVRQRMEPVALGAIVASCLAIDLTALAMWLAIDNDAYGKIVGLAFVWSFFALVVLGLVLAVVRPQGLAFVLYTGAIATSVAHSLPAGSSSPPRRTTWCSVQRRRSTRSRSRTTRCFERSGPFSSCWPPRGSARSRRAGSAVRR
jgi:hypothetical protein